MFSSRHRICVICVAISVFFQTEALFTRSFDVNKHLIFRLYTPTNRMDYQKLNASGLPPISSTSFDSRIPTRIFVHGFKSKEKIIVRHRDAFFNIGNFNFIAVDWIRGADTYNYLHSRALVKLVCRSYWIITHRKSVVACSNVTCALCLPDCCEIGYFTG